MKKKNKKEIDELDELREEEIVLDKELRVMESAEYGLKEFIHGLLIGVVFGFILALFILR